MPLAWIIAFLLGILVATVFWFLALRRPSDKAGKKNH
jgi:hypothetical protein